MKFIKRLRLIDYLIVVIVILAGVILFKFFNPREQWTDISVLAQNVTIFQANSLQKGDIEKSPTGEEIAQLVNVDIFDTPDTPASNKDLFIRAKILAKVNERSGDLEYKNKIIKIGSPIELRFSSGIINGRVMEMGDVGSQVETESKTVTVNIYNEWPWLADSLKEGDSEVDQNGEKIVEVMEKEAKPAEITVTTDSGETLLRTDPRKVDITLKVKMQVRAFGDELIFEKDKRLAVGETISFNIGNVKVKDAVIANIE